MSGFTHCPSCGIEIEEASEWWFEHELNSPSRCSHFAPGNRCISIPCQPAETVDIEFDPVVLVNGLYMTRSTHEKLVEIGDDALSAVPSILRGARHG